MNNTQRLYKYDFVPSTLVDLLRWRALHHPERLAFRFLVDGEEECLQMTYEELDCKARAIGALLQSFAAPGETVLLLYPPGLDYIAGYFGCIYAGVIAVPAYPPDPLRLDRTLPRLQAILADVQASIVLTTSPILSLAGYLFAQAPDLGALQWMATDTVSNGVEYGWQEPKLGPETLAFLQYTSGSTRTPKGVMVSHGNLLHNSSIISYSFDINPKDSAVIWLPPYHDMGLIGGILQPLYRGFPCVLMSPLSFLQRPLRWLQAISKYRATISGGPNFAYDLCVRKVTPEQKAALDLSSWAVAFSGAEPVRAETLDRFTAAFESCGFRREAFYPCYGLAEATLIVSGGERSASPITHTVQAAALEKKRVVPVPLSEEGARTLVGCGKNLPGQKIAIVDPETLSACQANEIGEIWVSGPSVAKGYWSLPEDTEKTFCGYLKETSEGPFLRTGDLGFLDLQGELIVAGRMKDLIIIDGFNHYPQDIEQTVEESHPAIRPGCSAAFSIVVNNQEQLVAVAEVADGSRKGNGSSVQNNLDLKEVAREVRRIVAAKHDLRIHDVVLIKARSIPKTSSGKIQRHACKVGYLAGTLEVLGA